MKLEEIKQMSDEELGQEIIDICRFPLDTSTPIDDLYMVGERYAYPHQICTELETVAEVETVVVKMVGAAVYTKAANSCATAAARERAEACLLALSENL